MKDDVDDMANEVRFNEPLNSGPDASTKTMASTRYAGAFVLRGCIAVLLHSSSLFFTFWQLEIAVPMTWCTTQDLMVHGSVMAPPWAPTAVSWHRHGTVTALNFHGPSWYSIGVHGGLFAVCHGLSRP